jgi:hypothetical protein
VRVLRAPRDVPFSAEAVDGWRAWSVVEHDGDVWLSSLTRAEDWAPAAPFVATCARRRHTPPRRGCSCGVYAAADPEELAGLGRIAGAAIGQVSLWGRIAEHSRGYRAGEAYPARLRLVCVACLGDGDGMPATNVDRDASAGRTRLVPLCEEHAAGRSLPPARPIEQRLLARYQVEAVPDASVERIRTDPRVAYAEQRYRRRSMAIVAASLSLLAVIALVGSVARARQGPIASVARAQPLPPIAEESIKTHGATSGGYVVRVLRQSRSIPPECGRVTRTFVVTVECDDPSADVIAAGVGSTAARHDATCGDATTVITTQGYRVWCWRPLAG